MAYARGFERLLTRSGWYQRMAVFGLRFVVPWEVFCGWLRETRRVRWRALFLICLICNSRLMRGRATNEANI